MTLARSLWARRLPDDCGQSRCADISTRSRRFSGDGFKRHVCAHAHGLCADTSEVTPRPDRTSRYPGLDQTTRWVPSRYAPSPSPVIWEHGGLRVHRAALLTLIPSVLVALAPFLGGAFIDDGLSDPLVVVVAFVIAWPGTVSAIHHEAAHVLVARHFGIGIRWVGYSGSGAYTIFHPPSTGVTLRAWIWTVAAGPISNAAVGFAMLAGWSIAGSSWFTAGGTFCMLVAAVELTTSLANAVPTPKSDGGAVLDALRIARSPVVL